MKENGQENLVKMMLVMFGLAVLVAIVVACLPAKGDLGRGWKDAMASMTRSVPLPSGKNWTSAQLQKGRHSVSYNNPQVRKTLNIPWARN